MPRRAFAAITLIFMMSVVAHAQYNMIHGYVIIPTQKHPDQFEVRLTNRDGELVISRTTVSSTGEYLFTNLDDGYDDILIRLDGFRESRTPIQLGNPMSIRQNPSPFYSLNVILIPDADSRRVEDEQEAYSKALLDEYAAGLAEVSEKHPDLAVTHLEKVVKAVPDFYDGHFNLGMVYQDLFRRREAELEFGKAHELNPESARPLLALGRLYVEESDVAIWSDSKPDVIQTKLAQARDALTEAVELDPKLALGFYYLGAVDFRSAEYASAEKTLKHAMELNPALFASRIILINVYIQQELWQKALDNIDAFLIEDPLSTNHEEVVNVRMRVVRRLHPEL